MEITGKIIEVLPVQSFTSKKDGATHNRYSFVLETVNTQYPSKLYLTVMGDDKWNKMGIVAGGQYSVSFDVESRKWQDKWFTEAKAYKAIRVDGGGAQQNTGTNTNNPPF